MQPNGETSRTPSPPPRPGLVILISLFFGLLVGLWLITFGDRLVDTGGHRRFADLRLAPDLAARTVSVLGVGSAAEATPATPEKDESIDTLVIDIETSDVHGAGTDSPVYLAVTWWDHDAGARGEVYKLPRVKRDNERGKNTTYGCTLPDDALLGESPINAITGLLVVNGKSHNWNEWHVASVRVKARDTGGRQWLISETKVNRWLDVNDGHAPVVSLRMLPRFEDLGVQPPEDSADTAAMELID